MKKVLFILLAFVTITANAEKQTYSYKTNGENRTVSIVGKDTVYIDVSGGRNAKTDPFFLLEGKRQIFSFKQSLLKMKEEYLKLKDDPNIGGDNNYIQMLVQFEVFRVGWTQESSTHYGRSKNLIPVFSVQEDKGNRVCEIRYSGQISDMSDSRFRQRCFMTFVNEEEIQSLIDVLPEINEDEILPEQPKNNIIRGGRSSNESYRERVERLAREGKGVH